MRQARRTILVALTLLLLLAATGATKMAYGEENVWLEGARKLQQNPEKYQPAADRFKECMQECDKRYNMYADHMSDSDMENHGKCQTRCINSR